MKFAKSVEFKSRDNISGFNSFNDLVMAVQSSVQTPPLSKKLFFGFTQYIGCFDPKKLKNIFFGGKVKFLAAKNLNLM